MSMQFLPDKQHIETVSLDDYNKLVAENEQLRNELMRCRQKVAHLLKEKTP